jgi:uncharacterized protein (DUF4415 family)
MASDPENPEWTEADMAASKGPEHLPAALLAAFPKTRAKRGRPLGATSSNKQQVTLRIDRDALERLKAKGPGWQSRINEAIRKAAGL